MPGFGSVFKVRCNWLRFITKMNRNPSKRTRNPPQTQTEQTNKYHKMFINFYPLTNAALLSLILDHISFYLFLLDEHLVFADCLDWRDVVPKKLLDFYVGRKLFLVRFFFIGSKSATAGDVHKMCISFSLLPWSRLPRKLIISSFGLWTRGSWFSNNCHCCEGLFLQARWLATQHLSYYLLQMIGVIFSLDITKKWQLFWRLSI